MSFFEAFGFIDWLLAAWLALVAAAALGMLGLTAWATRSGRAGKGRKDVPA